MAKTFKDLDCCCCPDSSSGSSSPSTGGGTPTLVANNQQLAVEANTPITFPPDVVAGTPCVANPSSIVIVGAPANGTVVVTAGGQFTYTPASGFGGLDQFTYQVCCQSPYGTVCDTAIVQLQVCGLPVFAIDIDAESTTVNLSQFNDFQSAGATCRRIAWTFEATRGGVTNTLATTGFQTPTDTFSGTASSPFQYISGTYLAWGYASGAALFTVFEDMMNKAGLGTPLPNDVFTISATVRNCCDGESTQSVDVTYGTVSLTAVAEYQANRDLDPQALTIQDGGSTESLFGSNVGNNPETIHYWSLREVGNPANIILAFQGNTGGSLTVTNTGGVPAGTISGLLSGTGARWTLNKVALSDARSETEGIKWGGTALEYDVFHAVEYGGVTSAWTNDIQIAKYWRVVADNTFEGLACEGGTAGPDDPGYPTVTPLPIGGPIYVGDGTATPVTSGVAEATGSFTSINQEFAAGFDVTYIAYVPYGGGAPTTLTTGLPTSPLNATPTATSFASRLTTVFGLVSTQAVPMAFGDGLTLDLTAGTQAKGNYWYSTVWTRFEPTELRLRFSTSNNQLEPCTSGLPRTNQSDELHISFTKQYIV